MLGQNRPQLAPERLLFCRGELGHEPGRRLHGFFGRHSGERLLDHRREPDLLRAEQHAQRLAATDFRAVGELFHHLTTPVGREDPLGQPDVPVQLARAAAQFEVG